MSSHALGKRTRVAWADFVAAVVIAAAIALVVREIDAIRRPWASGRINYFDFGADPQGVGGRAGLNAQAGDAFGSAGTSKQAYAVRQAI